MSRMLARSSDGDGDGVALRALDQSPQDRISSGLNQSATHVDIVIGSPEVQIDGIHADGSVVPVTRGDEFVITD